MGLFDFLKKEEKEPDWLSMMPKEMANMLLAEIRNNPQACKLDEIPQGTGNSDGIRLIQYLFMEFLKMKNIYQNCVYLTVTGLDGEE